LLDSTVAVSKLCFILAFVNHQFFFQ
jgi:hypothetical protein